VKIEVKIKSILKVEIGSEHSYYNDDEITAAVNISLYYFKIFKGKAEP